MARTDLLIPVQCFECQSEDIRPSAGNGRNKHDSLKVTATGDDTRVRGRMAAEGCWSFSCLLAWVTLTSVRTHSEVKPEDQRKRGYLREGEGTDRMESG